MQVFDADIRNLLIMSDMWRSRSPPMPLDFDAIMEDRFEMRPDASTNGKSAADGPSGSNRSGSNANGKEEGKNGAAPVASGSGSKLKDQRALSLKDNLELFVSR